MDTGEEGSPYRIDRESAPATPAEWPAPAEEPASEPAQSPTPAEEPVPAAT